MSSTVDPPQPKRKYPRRDAIEVARELVIALAPLCTQIIVAGSLRRKKPEVGDVEIIFIPHVNRVAIDLFGSVREDSKVDALLDQLVAHGHLEKRLNVEGATAWGGKNKLARHCASGIPVDFFTATEANWWNYIVCRTGGSRSNIAIASAAKAKGWKWNPYGEGFSRYQSTSDDGTLSIEVHPINSEREVFDFVALPFLEPCQRE